MKKTLADILGLNEDCTDAQIASRAEAHILGKTLPWIRGVDGQLFAGFFATFSGLKCSEVSVVFDTEDKVIYWIGPTSALPPDAKEHTTLTD